MSLELWRRVIERLALSPKQAEMVWLLLQGHEHKQVARLMGLSPDTLKTYTERLRRRLGVDGRNCLVTRVFAVAIFLLEHEGGQGDAAKGDTPNGPV